MYAAVAKLADALGSGPSGAKHPVEVRVLSAAFYIGRTLERGFSRHRIETGKINQIVCCLNSGFHPKL